jgi:hypothetical protein
MSPGAASATLLTKDNINDVALRSIVNDMLHIDPGKRDRISVLLKRLNPS